MKKQLVAFIAAIFITICIAAGIFAVSGVAFANSNGVQASNAPAGQGASTVTAVNASSTVSQAQVQQQQQIQQLQSLVAQYQQRDQQYQQREQSINRFMRRAKRRSSSAARRNCKRGNRSWRRPRHKCSNSSSWSPSCSSAASSPSPVTGKFTSIAKSLI